MNDAAINANGLTRNFGAIEAVAGLDLTVPAGEIFGLVGPDGAGKTTTMRLIAGLLRPTAGTVGPSDRFVGAFMGLALRHPPTL